MFFTLTVNVKPSPAQTTVEPNVAAVTDSVIGVELGEAVGEAVYVPSAVGVPVPVPVEVGVSVKVPLAVGEAV